MNKLATHLQKYLQTHTGYSSLRLFLFMLTIGIFLLQLSLCFYILWNTIHQQDINFVGIATLIGAMGVFLVGIYYSKLQQKKVEKNNII